MIEVSLLRELLAVDPETGVLTWLPRRADHFAPLSGHRADMARNKWNGQNAGLPALTAPSGNGYMVGRLLGRACLAHRAAFALYHGRWPTGQIDHIDHDGTNNRQDNLREVSKAENNRNRSKSSRNTSGHTGVHWCKQGRRWMAQIKINGRSTHIGGFYRIEDAVAARGAAEKAHGFHPNHGREVKHGRAA